MKGRGWEANQRNTSEREGSREGKGRSECSINPLFFTLSQDNRGCNKKNYMVAEKSRFISNKVNFLLAEVAWLF